MMAWLVNDILTSHGVIFRIYYNVCIGIIGLLMFSKTATAHGYLFLATILVAGSFVGADMLTHHVNPVSLTLLRFLLAALILAPLVLKQPNCWKTILSTFPRALVIGFFYCGFFMGLFQSLKTTSTINTGTIYTLVPLLTALLCLIFFKQAIGMKKIMAFFVGAIGTCWVIFKGDWNLLVALQLNQGDGIFFMGCISMCGYAVSMKYFYRGDKMLDLVFCTLLGGILWMSLGLVLLDLPLDWHKITGPNLYAMGYLVIGATIMTMYLYQKATVQLGPNQVMAYSYLNPVCLGGLLWLTQGLTLPLIILPGIIISTLATMALLWLYHKHDPMNKAASAS